MLHLRNNVRIVILFALITNLLLTTQEIAAGTSSNHVSGFVKWLKSNRNQETGLPYSHVGDMRFKNWTFTYDSAVVALAYIAAGEMESAKNVIDFYILRTEVHRLGGLIEAIISSSSLIKGQDYSIRTGANLWMGIASFHLYKAGKELKYLNFAKRIADFAISIQNIEKSDRNYGGIPLGPQGDPAYKGDQHIGHNHELASFTEIYATEINIDGYALFSMLYSETKEQKYGGANKLTLLWLKNNGYNFSEHRFNRGANDIHVATDVQSWGISALGVEMLNKFEENAAEKMINFVESNCISEDSFKKPDGAIVKIKGSDFIDKKSAQSLNRKPLVSPEWTFQLINTYSRLEQDYKNKGAMGRAQRFKTSRELLIENMIKLAVNINGALAYPYATQAEAELGHENLTPSEGNLSAIGVSYAILALRDFDPLITKWEQGVTH